MKPYEVRTTKYKADTKNDGIKVRRNSVCDEKWKQNTLNRGYGFRYNTHGHIQHCISNSTHRYSLYWGFSQFSTSSQMTSKLMVLLSYINPCAHNIISTKGLEKKYKTIRRDGTSKHLTRFGNVIFTIVVSSTAEIHFLMSFDRWE